MAKVPDYIIIKVEDKFTETLATLTEVLGMQADNSARIVSGEIPLSTREDFQKMAKKIRKVGTSPGTSEVCSNLVCDYCTGVWCNRDERYMTGCYNAKREHFTGRSLIVPKKAEVK